MKPQNSFNKFVRHSLNRSSCSNNGRLSVPWANSTLGEISFGADPRRSMNTIHEDESQVEEDHAEDDDDEVSFQNSLVKKKLNSTAQCLFTCVIKYS